LLRICDIKGISANWLLFGIGPKNIEDVDEKKISDAQKKSDVTQRRIMQQSEKIIELNDKIRVLERALSLSKLSKLVKYDAKVAKGNDSDIFNDNILPLLALVKSIQDVMFKVFEEFSEKSMDGELFNKISQYLSDNLEANKYSVISTLKELDRKFSKP
jgi:NhaP-type Na+/H+ and K+/H+ antiporter